MKKNAIIKTLDYLENVLDTQEDHDAIAQLRESVDLLEEVDTGVSSDPSGFSVPMEAVGAYTVYSDGGCRGNPGPGAWGAMGQRPDGVVFFESSGFEFQTTNNRMELTGAIESLKALANELEEEGLDLSHAAFLYSDSKYVVDGISKWVPGWKSRGWKKADKKTPENIELWQSFDEIAGKFSNLQFRWVKGHSGHPQNEHCDLLANKAMDENI
ncbi:ribonuclease H [Halobacteriovorax sp. DPLXC-1]